MKISEKHLAELKEIIKKEYGEEAYNKLSEEDLIDGGMRLMGIVEAIYEHRKKEHDITGRI